MKHGLNILFLWSAFCCLAPAAEAPSIQMMIKSKSGWFGLGKPQSITIELCNKALTRPLTDRSVNGDSVFHFLCRPVGDWKLDEDFLKDILPSICILQDEKKISLRSSRSIQTDSAGATTLLIEAGKTLRLIKPFAFTLMVHDSLISVTMNVPQDLWEGNSALVAAKALADSLAAAGNYLQAISTEESIIANPAYSPFLIYRDAIHDRVAHFDKLLSNRIQEYQHLFLKSDSEAVKDKAVQVAKLGESFKYVTDSLPNPRFNTGPADSGVTDIVARAEKMVESTSNAFDSLSTEIDYQEIRWLTQSNQADPALLHRKEMLQLIAYSLLYGVRSDTLPAPCPPMVPADVSSSLDKYQLKESFDAFRRICNKRTVRGASWLPAGFLEAISADTLPYCRLYAPICKMAQAIRASKTTWPAEEGATVIEISTDFRLTEQIDILRMATEEQNASIPRAIVNRVTGLLAGDAIQADSALQLVEQYREIHPDLQLLPYAMGKHYLKIRDSIRALAFFQRVLELDSSSVAALHYTAILQARIGNGKAAITIMTQALRRIGECWQFEMDLGRAYVTAKEYSKAIATYQNAMTLAPRNYQTAVAMGTVYQRMQKPAQAREWFMHAIEIDPKATEAIDRLNVMSQEAEEDE